METARELGGVYQETGRVERAADDRYAVRTATGLYDARRAASCSLCPEVGDEVLLAVPPAGDLFVLAVLVRADATAPERWSFDGDVELRTPGALRFVGGDGVELRSPTQVEVSARKVGVTAVEGTVGVERLQLVSGLVHATAKTVKTVLGTLDHVLERASTNVKRSYRFVEELDVTRAGTIDQRAKESFSVRGKNAFVAADELVKVDGDQIHLG